MEVKLDYVVIESFNLYKYREVYKILEMEGDSIKRAETTSKYVEAGTFVPKGYFTTNVSASIISDKPVKLDIFTGIK